jgi:hypothetical protein
VTTLELSVVQTELKDREANHVSRESSLNHELTALRDRLKKIQAFTRLDISAE